MAPAEAAQKRAQGRWGLDGAAEDAGRPARARIGVVDAVTARERGGDQGQQLVPDVRLDQEIDVKSRDEVGDLA